MERKEAAELGLTTYNTGRPCKHGHAPIRSTVSGNCVECNRIGASKGKVGLMQTIINKRSKLVKFEMILHQDIAEQVRSYALALNDLMGVPHVHNEPSGQKKARMEQQALADDIAARAELERSMSPESRRRMIAAGVMREDESQPEALLITPLMQRLVIETGRPASSFATPGERLSAAGTVGAGPDGEPAPGADDRVF